MIRLNDILEKVSAYRPDADLDLIKKAYVYSAKVHQGQIRKSGEPYLIHPLEVAGLLAELKLDEASIVAGLLHDTIEDTLAKPEEIRNLFGQGVLDLVEGVTKLSNVPVAQATHEEKQAENLRKMLVAMAKDIRVILVKLADRTHNMRTLEHMKPESQKRIAQETLDIYAPLAHRLGIQWIKIELEDLAFKYLKPAEYAAVEGEVAQTQAERQKFIDEVVLLLQVKLKEAGLSSRIDGRPKHLYSIWRKMSKNQLAFSDLHDLVAFRLILQSVPACYEALGLIHSLWKPVPGRFKDYIAIPKPNRYQSLHTTVIGPSGERIEIQMRTEEMHRIAEEGIAAHWAYKEGKAARDEKEFAWLRQLMEWQSELKDSREFLDTVKVDLFADEVFVFTPKGDVKSLPYGSTPIDLAYAIHSEVGSHCAGAKVAGKIVPLRYKLKNGDSVEILTNPNVRPNKDWLAFVKTSRAQARIRAYIKQQQREKSLDIGRDLLDREFKRFDLNFSKFYKSSDFVKHANDMGHARADDLVSAVGYGKLSPMNVLTKVVPPEKLAERNAATQGGHEPERPANGAAGRLTELFKRVAQRARTTGGVAVGGIDDVLVRYGKCCGPVPGDPIVGFITRGRGVTVHVRGCKKAMESDLERRVDVNWDVRGEFKRSVHLRVKSDDKKGLLAKLSETFADVGVNIVHADARAAQDKRGAVSTFEIEVTDAKQLNDAIRAIGNIPGVHTVDRF